MRLLLLSGLKTVEVAEHTRGLEQIHLLHLLLIKSLLVEDVLGIHSVLHTPQRVQTSHIKRSLAGIVADLVPPVHAYAGDAPLTAVGRPAKPWVTREISPAQHQFQQRAIGMEFKEVIGRRRSIRYFVPYRPVEREKIQTILEAARLASCAVNATFLRAIVVQRDDLDPATLEALKTPVSALNLDLAPVHIYFYGDLRTLRQSRGQTLKDLIDVGALNPSHGWSHAFVDEVAWRQIIEPLTKDPIKLVGAVGSIAA
jgi:hypothetical protein